MKRLGIKRCMVAVMLVGAFRWLIAAVCSNPWIFTGTMALNGVMLVPVIVELVEYLHAIAPDGLQTSVQTVLKAGFSMIGVLAANIILGQFVQFLNDRGVNGIRYGYAALLLVYVVAGMVGFRKWVWHKVE